MWSVMPSEAYQVKPCTQLRRIRPILWVRPVSDLASTDEIRRRPSVFEAQCQL
jgi:hypothetical protein